jgi:nucleotide-binding universal stress UspA family protein
MGVADHARWLHVVRELKLYGLTMTASAQASEQEYEDLRSSMVRDEIENAQRKLENIPHAGLKINYKIISGKSGYELAQFAVSKTADLLIVGAPSHRFSLLDRFFTHDLEYLFANLPCNLLIVNPGKTR